MKRTKYYLLQIALLALALCFVPLKASANEHPPSILLITIDNLRPDHMSVYGYAKDTTPYLKKFAGESAVFTNAFSTSSWTAPGMVSIFTGYYPPVHAQHGRFSYYDDKMPSALKVLASHGYDIVGQAIRGPSHQGFGFQEVLGKRPNRLQSFIEQRANDPAPFFAWAHITDVHLPYNPSELNADLFNANSRTNAAIEAVKKHRIILRHPDKVDVKFEHAGKVRFTKEDIPVVKALYDAEIADVDQRLKGHLETMRETGLLDRTIVIISADHGEELFDHGWLGHASTGYDAKLYDELIRIPLIIRVPDQSLRGRFDAMVQGVDFMPTIYDLLGINAAEVKPAMQGKSMLPVIKGKKAAIRDYVFNQTTLKGWTTPRDEMPTRIVSIRSLDKKLIRIPDEGVTRTEAYDLKRDPGEQENIYATQAERFDQLEQALESWIVDNRLSAATLVMDGARRRIEQIADAALGGAKLDEAVSAWEAIQTMEKTWSLEPDRFFEHEPYASQWREIQRTAAHMVGAAMNCRADEGALGTQNPDKPGSVEFWECN